VQMPQLPTSFDFTINEHKRAAARRVGAVGATEFSGELTETRKVQKTATEVETDAARGGMISSADVDRFNQPFAELYQQLFEVLKRERVALPMIANDKFKGMTSTDIYDWPVLIVPASSSKTLDPDHQFRRATAAWSFAVDNFLKLGVTLDPQAAAEDILAFWDPFVAERWIKSPTEGEPGGLPPVYKILEEMMRALGKTDAEIDQILEAVENTAKLAEENSQDIEQGKAEAKRREEPATFFTG